MKWYFKKFGMSSLNTIFGSQESEEKRKEKKHEGKGRGKRKENTFPMFIWM